MNFSLTFFVLKMLTPEAVVDLGIEHLGSQYADPKSIYFECYFYFTGFDKLLLFAFSALFNMSADQVQLF